MNTPERRLHALMDEVEEVFRRKGDLFEFTTESFRNVLAAREIHRQITDQRLTIDEFYSHISTQRSVPDASDYIMANWRSVIPHFVQMLSEEQLPQLVDVIVDDPIVQAVAEVTTCRIARPPIVILAHGIICNADAIFTLADLYEELACAYGLNLVCVEGAEGIVDTSWFRAFPDKEIRTEVAKHFVRKGEITAPEYVSITADTYPQIFGLEKKEYYVKLHAVEAGKVGGKGLPGELDDIFTVADLRRKDMLDKIKHAIEEFKPMVLAVETASVGVYRGPDLLRDTDWSIVEMEPKAKGGINWELYGKVMRGDKEPLEQLLSSA